MENGPYLAIPLAGLLMMPVGVILVGFACVGCAPTPSPTSAGTARARPVPRLGRVVTPR
ncbi:hypothetical protein [Nocardiopsis sp. FIRDI 009]|uniref:hypothetical protein n=1 Tax=Nocardiopsis sp. FIRDI 009 TaxID=714197 RepID=UPI0018E51A44|nr:hypothetical protein [Nocardiopsis sp. FIRDI 009]